NLTFKNGFVIDINHRNPESAEKALSFCLRNSPRYMIVGEILDPAVARTYIESIEAGFSGTVSTIHADNAKVTTRRLATLATKNSNINKEDWLITADETIDLVIYVSFNQTTGVRMVKELYDVKKGEYLAEEKSLNEDC
ncbi:MAG: ATPase, T2SS/T4P/T4SS family, partial [Marinicella sp.]